MQSTLIRFLLGFVGTILGFKLLPRIFRYLFRRVLPGLISEIVAVVITGLLTEKAIDLISPEE